MDNSSLEGAVDERPNLVLIIADDMAWDDCGACGHPNIRTPNLDKLAANGMMFHQAFLTTSSCSPSRSSIVTGTYPHQTDAEQLHWEIPPEKITFVEKLTEAGYWTGQAGKWHMGDHIKGRFDFLAEEKPMCYGNQSESWMSIKDPSILSHALKRSYLMWSMILMK